MRNPVSSRPLLMVTIGIVAAIVHGSLYPYAFRIPLGSTGPVGALLQTWARPPTGFGDLIANLLLYVPLGFFGVLALRLRRRLLGVTFLGLLFCTAIEIAQFYDADRVTNMSDVYLNTCGTLLGGLGATLMNARLPPLLPGMQVARAIPCLLLVAMLGYHLFPYVPTIDARKYWYSVKPVFLHPSFAPWPIFRYFVVWLVASYLLSTVARRHTFIAVLLFIAFVLGAKIAIVNLVLTAPEITGALLAAFASIFLVAHSRASASAVFALLCVLVIALRLQPFDFHAPPAPFGWLPLRGLLHGSLEVDVVSLFEKIFLYGSLIWIGSEAGLGLRAATGVVAAMLLGTSVAETYLSGRSAEITDALIVLFLGAVFAALNSRRRYYSYAALDRAGGAAAVLAPPSSIAN